MKKNRTIIIAVVIFLLIFVFFVFSKKKIQVTRNQVSYLDLTNLSAPCQLGESCGHLQIVDCGSAYDGPFYYVEKETGKIISQCGGYRRQGELVDCPPSAWTCSSSAEQL